jgi:hypothetical protein
MTFVSRLRNLPVFGRRKARRVGEAQRESLSVEEINALVRRWLRPAVDLSEINGVECPSCGENLGLPIAYGLPSRLATEAGKTYVSRGCVLDDARWECQGCFQSW